MSARIGIKKEVLDWAIAKSNKDYETIEEKFPKISTWRLNKSEPTFKQIQSLSKFLNIPFGYLIVDTPPKEDIELLNFRTVNSVEGENTSRELIDTINEMVIKQDWMREYLINEGYESNPIVNKLNSHENPIKLAGKLRELIDLPKDWYSKCKNDAYTFLRNKLSYNGILIMQNGIVKNNTHRQLNVKEFRAFCLIDEYAPLIFINTKDSQNGKVFSLLHELAHIGLGVENIYNENSIKSYDYNEVEAICNKIAAEILVPKDKFIYKWENETSTNNKDKIYVLSNEFVASKIVIARKALDNGFINNDLYKEIVNETNDVIKHFYESKSSGGNAIYNARSRIDKNFVLAVSDGLQNGRALYSDIYKLTGINNKMFNKVIKSLEGEL